MQLRETCRSLAEDQAAHQDECRTEHQPKATAGGNYTISRLLQELA